MRAKKVKYNSDFAKLHYAMGWEEGKSEGWARAILIVLDERGIAVAADQETLIMHCTDLDQLSGWLRRAVTVESADQVFA